MEPRQLLTSAEVEQEFGLKRGWLAKNRHFGVNAIPYHRLGRRGSRVLYRRADLEAWLSQRRFGDGTASPQGRTGEPGKSV